jgi:pimeloyl-ACP methyl ester carboxylesterase
MLRMRVDGHDMAYIDVGAGPAIVCVHGSLGDFRVWSGQLGPLSRAHRVIAVSLRHFFPDRCEGRPATYRIARHVADVIAFIEGLNVGAVHLMGHSRGGHVAFRVAIARPDLVDRLILAEPGGDLDATLDPDGRPAPPMRAHVGATADRIAAGDEAGALAEFLDRLEGPGGAARFPPSRRREMADNIATMTAQVDEGREPFSRAAAEAVRARTLLIGGAATPGAMPRVLAALAAHIPGARRVTIPNARHFMMWDDPDAYNAAVLQFLEAP